MRPRTVLAPALALAGALAVLPATLVGTATPAEARSPGRQVALAHWDTSRQLAQGESRGLVARKGRLVLGRPAGTSGGYEYGDWVSPWVAPGFSLTELIPSWNARTPGGSFVRVEVRGRTASTTSSWDTVAEWARGDHAFTRRSGESQTDDLGRVAYDTWITGGVAEWQVRVTLLRKAGGGKKPKLLAVSGMASRLPAVSSVRTSAPGARKGAALGTVLDVPRYSQMVHRKTYPQYGGGGQAWCSPTSTTMLLGYYQSLPPASDYAWVRQDHPDRVVPHLARSTYDARFGGTGNWSFNTAYAATLTKKAFVTRLRSLREAERFIAAGVPLVASVTFSSGQLSGAPISSTNGHLLVIVGFTKSGDVVVNDPAASSRDGVRRTYNRGQFENAWLSRYQSGSSLRGSGGIVYVVQKQGGKLPARHGKTNW
jgi:hypothetical protein